MKYMKMAAIAMMALALFSCKKNDEPKKAEAAVLTVRLNDSELRALEAAIPNKAKTEITDKVTIKLFPSGRTIDLTDTQITEAKSTAGTNITVGEVVTHVSIVKANAEVTDATKIIDWQGKQATFGTEIPLTAPKTQVTEGVGANGKDVVYSVELQPVPAFARVEVAGDIEAGLEGAGIPKNSKSQSAYKSIKVEQVYINNYLPTRTGDRVYCAGKAGKFVTEPVAAMCDKIEDAKQADFKAKNVVAGYQLFPIKENEAVSEHGFYDHIILRLTVTYDTEVAKGYPTEPQTRYVTMVKFFETTPKDITSFEAGKIYKLALEELTKDFTTDENGNPTGPDTPDPEQDGKHMLNVKVKPFEWTAVNIKPDVDNNGYKK